MNSIEQNFKIGLDKVTVSTGYDHKESLILLNIGDGQKLPDPLTNGSYDLIWWNSSDYINPYDDPNVETVKCEAKAGDAIIVLRKDNSSNKNLPGKIYGMTSINNEIKGLSYYNIPQIHDKTKHDPTTVDGGAALSSNTQIPVHGSAQHTGIIGTEGEITFTSTGGHTHDGTNSTKLPWVNIDKTISNVADITTKSHTSLTDIGTNTHTAIDTHIASTIAHGTLSTIVGLDDTQTLTNKTIKGTVGLQLPVGINKWV